MSDRAMQDAGRHLCEPPEPRHDGACPDYCDGQCHGCEYGGACERQDATGPDPDDERDRRREGL